MSIELPITLKKSPAPARESVGAVSAWYLGSGNVADWIARATQWPCDQEKLRFFPIPTSRTNPLPQAVVIYSPQKDIPDHSGGRGFGLRPAIGNLLVPDEAALSFPLSHEEAAKLAPHDFAVLLPGVRWIAFDLDEGLGMHQLIAPLTEKVGGWNLAREPEQTLPRLLGIDVWQIPDPDNLMDAGREDIGSGDPSDLPKKEGESTTGNGIKDLASLPKKAFLKALLKFVESRPKTASAPTWVNRLGSWAGGKLDDLMQSQNRELDRLLELMKKDPDKALKFALPLTGSEEGRGVAPPGGSLGLQNVNFNLSDLFGSGEAVSPWNVGGDQYWKLQQSYREAANRELRLGRYRRAAYIFGKLLGDFNAAANALEQGGFFKEAAVLYEKKMNNREKAAECFRKAGLIEEAVRLYRELEKHEVLAELFRQLGREREAREEYVTALEIHLKADRPLDAARISREGLNDDLQALRIYNEAWPASKSAGECLRHEFMLTAELGEHERASQRIKVLTEMPWSAITNRTLVAELIHQKKAYPIPEIGEQAADSARVVAGQELSKAPRKRRPILDLLPDLDPSDRLLRRDARRFGEQKARLEKQPLAKPGLTGRESVSLTRKSERATRRTPAKAIAACAFDGGLFVAKIEEKKGLTVTHTPREGLITSMQWNFPDAYHPYSTQDSFKLTPVISMMRMSKVAIVVTNSLQTEFPFQKCGSGSGIEIGNNESFRTRTLGFGSNDDGLLWKLKLVNNAGMSEVSLESSYRGEIRATYHFANAPADLFEKHNMMPLVVTRGQVFFAAGQHLYRWYKDQFAALSLPDNITELAVMPAFKSATSLIAVGMTNGVAVVHGLNHWDEHDILPQEYTNVRVAFTPSNYLVVAGEERVGIYKVENSGITFESSFQFESTQNPLCIAPGLQGDSFEVVTTEKIYEFSIDPKK